MKEKPELDLHFYEDDLQFNDLMVIVSHPTIGMIAPIVVNYLIEELELDLIGSITSDDMHPAAVIHKGRPLPPMRIYAGEYVDDPDADFDQLVVISSDLPVKKEFLPVLADKIIDWSTENNYRSIVTIEGINREKMDVGGDAKVFHVGSTDEALSRFEDLTSEKMESGMVSGLSGLLLYKCNLQNVSAISLLGEAHRQFPDSRSAAAILSVLNNLVPNIEMDPDPLLEQAEKIEDQIQDLMSQINQGKQQKQGMGASRGMFA